ncbi:hypothetical protein W02_23630 [Nitrospira sp. KM1]|nr:hypothetical protein W02_23630 [Nitrospira sp. KM1]
MGITIASPDQNASTASGPVTIVYSTTNFTIGGVGQPHMRFVLDGDPNPYTVLNGNDKKILYNGVETTEPEWLSPTSFRFNNLPDGQHAIVFQLVNANGTDNQAVGSSTALYFSKGVAGAPVPTIVPISPLSGSEVPGPVTVSFVSLNHSIGVNGQSHLHFFVDGDTEPHHFYNGPGIDDENGVVYKGGHTHLVHWHSPTSFRMFALGAGQHQVQFVLVDAAHQPLANPEAMQILTFSVAQSTAAGDFDLEPMIDASANGMAFAPGDQLFYTDGKGGNVWVIDTAGGAWQRRTTPFYHTEVGQLGEQGLAGIAIDPNYATNKFVYIYFSTPDQQRNRLVRVTDMNGQAGNEQILIDGILAADQHNGGVLLFGADGKLYVTVGEATQDNLAQDPASLNGKILRINTDGSIPADNPFPGSRTWLYGVRNSFGLAVHPATNDLWFTDNGPTVNDEVNLAAKGGNYGWPETTGKGDPRFIDPAFVLEQPVGITNIVALQATSVYPSLYHNNLFFTDYVEGKIHRLVLDPSFKTVASDSVALDVQNAAGGLIAFKQGPDGYMYVSGSTSSGGSIYRVVLNPNAPQ